ncbi:glycoside hydrolase family 17 protein [Conidiobolus coronatus NRRL 28638]|uniref:glucan endo-1,3-beta-D-glucosidase n=1 Tax=Conidiobolus coronatus (strain ATCC 28846 / CBS 209.66 / NRRL 28638) TaxID=796925 RepID=A0A137P5F7_CONC2|nr:glycoside hydrolase family 17 protein [Conidiobolus coronatus NRRL 28638]|eukprot:KXN70246.1 glycoside hydrolase family 17 protein [Conidiobolus coronatus NRRL 28638]
MNLKLIQLTLATLLTSSISAQKPVWGLGYNAKHSDGQCPDLNKVIEDFKTMLTITDRIRTFGIQDCNQGELVIQAAKATGMKLSLGMFINQYDAEYNAEYSRLQALVGQYKDVFVGNVDSVIVGSEAIYRKETTNSAVAAKVVEVKKFLTGAGVPTLVTAADIKDNWYDSDLTKAVDMMYVNAYPYWEGIPIDQAINHLWWKIQEVKDRTPGKRFVLSETGWPQGGNNFGAAVPSKDNQIRFFNQFICSVAKSPVPLEYYWFSAFDETWNKDEAGMSWGIFDANRQLKPGYQFPVPCDKF